MLNNKFYDVTITLMLGSLGAAIAYFLNFPAPYLIGPAIIITMVSVLGIGLFGAKLQISPILRDICFLLIGISMGSGATPQVIETAKQWPLSFIILALTLFLIMALGNIAFRKWFNFAKMDAVLASTPGHLSFVIALSEKYTVDTQKITLIQSVRVLFLTILLPFMLMFMDLERPIITIKPQIMPLFWLPILLILSSALGYVLKKINFPAAFLIAGMLISTITHLNNMVSGNIPQWLIIPSFIIMGCLIGTRFFNIHLSTIKTIILPSLFYTIFSLSMAATGACLVYLFVDLPFAQLLISFAPGGVEAMVAMAFLLNIDPTFVAAHHIVRLFVLVGLLPIFFSKSKEN